MSASVRACSWALFAVLVLVLAACSQSAARETAMTTVATPSSTSSTKPRAWVMGVQWLSPLVRRDYPAEWNLLWRIGLASLNANDDYKDDTPATVQRVLRRTACRSGSC